MIQLKHPYIVRLYGKWKNDKDEIFLISEFVNNGDLLKLLRNSDVALSKSAKVSLMLQITSGLKYLHSKKIIHRDLAARNILIEKEENGKLTAKVTDFGLSRQSEDSVYYAKKEAAMPIRWSAPESLTKRKFSEKSDIHSLAIVFFEIISDGQVPFFEFNNEKVAHLVTKGEFPSKTDKVDEALYEMAKSIVNLDPEKRPSLDEITAKIENIKIDKVDANFTSHYKLDEYTVSPDFMKSSKPDSDDEKDSNKNKGKKSENSYESTEIFKKKDEKSDDSDD